MKQQPISFRSVPFDEMVKWLKKPRRVSTLGQKSYIDASAPKANTIHIVGRNGKERDFNRAYWDYVCEVIDDTALDRRSITTNYNHLRDNRFAPSVPALCRAYCEEKGGNNE